MHKLGIIAIGYNRKNCLCRLLDSLNNANYYEDKIDLIISIDNSGNSLIESFAIDFSWKHGEKIIRTFPERQGLKQHILSCGEYLKEYDALAIFEDDVVVSPSFYSFMREAVDFYFDNKTIGGISLYSYQYNVNARYPFIPDKGNYDTYFLQYAQSWGQVWLKDSFLKFLDWVKNNNIIYDEMTPDWVNSWPDKSSWLKLHIKYCVDNGLFFVYSYHSYTTCFSDPGEHVDIKVNLQQVPLVSSPNDRNFKFAVLDDDAIKYDVFFERIIKDCNVLVDLYGTKTKQYGKKRYLLSTKRLDYEIIQGYSLEYRPQELNYLLNVLGNDFFLYDTLHVVKNKNKVTNRDLILFNYFYQYSYKYKKLPYILISFLSERIKKFFKKNK